MPYDVMHHKHTAFSWGCYGRYPTRDKISHSGKRISPETKSRVIFFFQSVIFFSRVWSYKHTAFSWGCYVLGIALVLPRAKWCKIICLLITNICVICRSPQAHIQIVSECVLCTATWTILVPLYHGENKLHWMRWCWCRLFTCPTHLIVSV